MKAHAPSVVTEPLVDRFGRVASDLRISLTDKCTLRCAYCMPAEGLDWLGNRERLSDGELITLVEIFLDLGVNSVRLTGGEPLLHRTLPEVIAHLGAHPRSPEISLTTNGLALAGRAEVLVAAGLDRINVSLDTLDADRFAQITRRRGLDQVLGGIAAAAEAGLDPVKINTVLMRGVNDDEAPALLRWALAGGYWLRFIEHMPLDAQQDWQRSDLVTALQVLDALQGQFRLRPVGRPGERSAPAELFEVIDGPGLERWPHERTPTVGLVAAVTRPFCRDCDRLRLTADGQLRTCLFAEQETDLRGPLRDGASAGELAEIIRAAVSAKQAGHRIGEQDFTQPARPMSAIGG